MDCSLIPPAIHKGNNMKHIGYIPKETAKKLHKEVCSELTEQDYKGNDTYHLYIEQWNITQTLNTT